MRGALLVMAAAVMALTGCVASKAGVDYTYSEGIIWPGGGQKPRVQYLWSLSRVKGAGDGSFLDVLAGPRDENPEERRYSDFLQRPHGLFVSDDNMLYITDPGAGRVSIVDLVDLTSYQIDRFNEVPLSSPIGVVALPDGRIFISDSDYRLVGIFEPGGKFVRFLEGEFKRPTGMAVDNGLGIVYVSDTWEHTIYKYDFGGRRLGRIGEYGHGPGQLHYPTHLFVSGDGNLHVSDTLNFRVQVFSPEGEVVSVFGEAGDAYGQFDKIKGIAVDSGGHIYAADSVKDTIQIFDRDGRLMLFFGEKGSMYGRFRLPAGLFIDGKDRIFVADTLNQRIQVFRFMGGE
jgi:DNA-binding beta-propeller fold protein YncE